MIFQNTGSHQKNAAPLQSFVKKGNTRMPDARMSSQNPFTPRDKGAQNSFGVMLPKLPTLSIITPVMYLGMTTGGGE